MRKFLSVLGLAVLALSINGCKPDDDSSSEPLRDYQTQYNVEKANIEDFLKSHTYSSTDGQGSFEDAVFDSVAYNDPTCLWNDPRLGHREVTANDVTYTVYWLKLNEGASAHPCNVDQVLTSYQGLYIYDNINSEDDDLTPVEFETNNYPQTAFSLESTIRGWGEILPEFGTAGSVINVPGEPLSYNDFGAGVMFIPSGLAYYSVYQGTIPSYSTLIFKFKLYSLTRLDHDGDGIPSWLEDVDQEDATWNPEDPMKPRYMYYFEDSVTDDTDGDGIPDYRDVDDDGDNVLTKVESRIPGSEVDGEWQYYPFASSPEDPQGIPSCSGDYTTPTRLRKHMDPSCQ
ncbi:FKBP-type peptidyl-prolyl cis-trans isomerase [Flavobacterium silvaticum]|uniref:FKBP-type peptidylprolyl isomerase n=1 Tax=Flavobacterium silvaticum TaxID=1852020 RepID=A0A972FV32_9FLAO|nr:FKBP-type peptidylprolyl isomerase [Flavobacterium silvaticum]NMH28160.1 FKBP-type peptidylprolyl isomerase [Flavobacterium silvaticum]